MRPGRWSAPAGSQASSTAARPASEWCQDEWTAQENEGEAPYCVVKTFGSVKLNVHTPDADIDVVLHRVEIWLQIDTFSTVVPRRASRRSREFVSSNFEHKRSRSDIEPSDA